MNNTMRRLNPTKNMSFELTARIAFDGAEGRRGLFSWALPLLASRVVRSILPRVLSDPVLISARHE